MSIGKSAESLTKNYLKKMLHHCVQWIDNAFNTYTHTNKLQFDFGPTVLGKMLLNMFNSPVTHIESCG